MARKGKKKKPVFGPKPRPAAKAVKKAIQKEVKKDVAKFSGTPVNRPVFLKPRPMMPAVRKAVKGQLILADREFIGSVVVTSSQQMGDHLLRQVLSPQDLIGTRISVFAKLYEKYRFRKAIVHYVPMVPSTAAGTIIGYVDVDPADGPTTGTLSVRMAESATGSLMHHIFQKGAYRLPQREGNGEFYFTSAGAEERITKQGLLDIVAVSPFTTAQTIGFLYLDYEIEFKISHTVGVATTQFTGYSSGGTVSSSNVMGTAPTQDTNADFTLSFSGAAVYFPSPGTWFVEYKIIGATAACDIDFVAIGATTFTQESSVRQGTVAICRAYCQMSDAATDGLSIVLTGGTGTQTSKIICAPVNSPPALAATSKDGLDELRDRLRELEHLVSLPRSSSGLKSPLNR